jgi:hypothetical protein
LVEKGPQGHGAKQNDKDPPGSDETKISALIRLVNPLDDQYQQDEE